MNKKKIIVTGGLGFIGTNLIISLIKKNYIVLNIDKISPQSNKRLKFLKNKNYRFLKLNLSTCNQKKLNKIIYDFQPEYLINLASETHVDRSIDNPKKILKSNINLVINLLVSIKDLAKSIKNKIKFIHIGTDEIYGELNYNESKKFNEDSLIKPNNPYSASKASQIHIINSFNKTFNLNYIIINPSNNFGPYQFPEKLIPKSIELIKKNKKVEIYGKGKNIRNWIYVKDTVDGIYKIMRKGKKNQIYNIASKNKISNIDLVKKLFKLMGREYKNNIKFVKDRPGHDKKYLSSSEKIKKLGWSEKNDISKNIKKTIEWYLDKDNLDFFNSRYLKLNRLGKTK